MLGRGKAGGAVREFPAGFTEAQQRAFLDARLQQAPDRSAGSFLAGLFHQKLIEVLLLEAGIKTGTAMAAVPAEKKEKLYGLIQAMPAKMTGYMDFSHAQVCSGGVSTEEIDRETMESRLVPDFILPGNWWTLTAPAAATICSGPGPAGTAQGFTQ